MRLTVLVILLATAGVARAQSSENSPLTCGDGIDNDNNGLADCDDPKCNGVGVCGALHPDDKTPATPMGQMIGGVIMIVAGAGVGGASAALFLDAGDQHHSDKRVLDYAIGGVMAAAGAALVIGGALIVRRGWKHQQEEKDLGLAFDWQHLTLRF